MSTHVERLVGPERTFSNPFTAWHARALPRPMYMTDVDGVEVEGEYPVIIYEVKTIPSSLYQDICSARENTDGSVAAQLYADFFGRVNVWQLRSLRRLTRPQLVEGLFVVTPANAEAFWIQSFDVMLSELGPTGNVRARLDAKEGGRGGRKLRKDFYKAEDWAGALQSRRCRLALQWAQRERDDARD